MLQIDATPPSKISGYATETQRESCKQTVLQSAVCFNAFPARKRFERQAVNDTWPRPGFPGDGTTLTNKHALVY